MSGVITGAIAVEIAVIDTESSMLPFDSDEMKFEILPPGHDATRIIPNAIIGVITGLRASAIANVTAGNATHCSSKPTMTERGLVNTSLKS